MTKVYLSGPMTGYPDFNRAAFADAAYKLRELGFEVVNPHQLPEPVLTQDEDYNWRQYLARDVELLIRDNALDGVVVLPGWEQSRGSVLELHVAQYVGLKVFPLEAVLRAGEVVKEAEGENANVQN